MISVAVIAAEAIVGAVLAAAPAVAAVPREVGRNIEMKLKQHIKVILTCLCFLLLCNTVQAQLQIPAVPAHDGYHAFIQDYTGTILKKQRVIDQIRSAQKQAFEQYSTPIVVVVITRMSAFGYYKPGIESFATQWFNEWEIGTEKTNGGNQGILLLVSIYDRKARIELGKDWGHDFDKHCQQIMDNVIISQFKQADYSTGIIEGTEALLKMASIKPNGKINRLPQPKSSLPFLTRFRQGDISWITRGFFAAIGLAGVALSFRAKPDSYLKTFLFCYGLGFAIFGIYPLAAVRSPIVVILFIVGLLQEHMGWLTGNSSSITDVGSNNGFSSTSNYSSSYSSSYGGGGFGGGSSGGGGASGSW